MKLSIILEKACCKLQAAEAIEALRVSVDTLIVIPNDKLLDGMPQYTSHLGFMLCCTLTTLLHL